MDERKKKNQITSQSFKSQNFLIEMILQLE